MPLHKVQALVDLFQGDEEWVEQMLDNAVRTQKSADAMGVRYKADDGEYDDSELTLSAADLAAIRAIVAALVQSPAQGVVEAEKRADPRYPPIGLLDQKKKDFNPATDFFARAMGADQIERNRP